MSAQTIHIDPEETIRKLKAKVARLEKALAAAQPAPIQERDWSWECNECGSKEFTSSVSDEDMDFLCCPSCGCDELHKAYTTPPAAQPAPVREQKRNGNGKSKAN
jgi:hypothetical protein